MNVLDRRLRTGSPSADDLRHLAVQVPNHWTPIVIAAATTRTAQVFLGFSRFPQARVFEDASGDSTVRLTDMRFAAGLEDDNTPLRARRSSLFTVTVKIGPDNEILEERLGQ